MAEKFPIVVTAALIKRDGKYLITQRPKSAHNALRWEFPGGKLDFGEDLRACLEREIKEELDIKIKVKELFEYSSHVYESEKHIVLIAFFCDFVSGNIKKKEINDFAWVSPKDMDSYDITEADLPFVDKLKSI